MESSVDKDIPSPFKVLQATPDDAEAIYTCSRNAMVTSYLLEMVYPKEKAHLTAAEDLFNWRVRRQRKAMEADDLIYFKAVPTDDSDKVVG